VPPGTPPGTQPGTMPGTPIGLARMFAAFLWLGGTSFGGGTAWWLYREMVLRRRWIDDRDFLAMLAVGQIMPGSNGIKLTVLIGQQLRGVAGAAVALCGLLAVPFAVVLAIGAIYVGFGEHRIVTAMLDGVAAAVIGLTCATGFTSIAQGAPGPAAWVIAAATVLAVGVLRWPMLPVIAALAPVSIGLALAEARRR
jgi:chromate transporter